MATLENLSWDCEKGEVKLGEAETTNVKPEEENVVRTVVGGNSAPDPGFHFNKRVKIEGHNTNPPRKIEYDNKPSQEEMDRMNKGEY